LSLRHPLQLPLTVDDLQQVLDSKNPMEIPELVDLLARLQNTLVALRDEATVERSDFGRYVRHMIDSLWKSGKEAEIV
jgi:hypothetical protein